MKSLIFVFTLMFIFSCCLDESEQIWHKGNLHTHSLWSDGDDFPEMIIKWYKDHNYQFIAISDHNTIAESEFWYEIKEIDKKNKTLEKYIKNFGEWVETKIDSNKQLVRLKKFNEYRLKMEIPDSFLVIRSEEVTTSFEKKPIHINVTNIHEKIEPLKGKSIIDVMQKVLDEVHEQKKKLNVPMFAHINHPNFRYGISTEDMKKLNGERFFELYNGHPLVNNEGDEFNVDTETMWDLINVHYYKEGKPLLLGIATDDSHNYHEFSAKKSNSGRGWVMVNSKKLELRQLIDAMEKGDFYASTGVKINKIYKDSDQLFISIEPEKDIDYEIIFYGYKEGNDQVQVLKRKKGVNANYTFQNDDIFIRAKVNSNSKKDSPPMTRETKKAWTQPVLLK